MLLLHKCYRNFIQSYAVCENIIFKLYLLLIVLFIDPLLKNEDKHIFYILEISEEYVKYFFDIRKNI